MQVIRALLEREGEITVVTSIDGCMDYLAPLEKIEKQLIHFRNDSILDMDKLTAALVHMGYERVGQVFSAEKAKYEAGRLDEHIPSSRPASCLSVCAMRRCRASHSDRSQQTDEQHAACHQKCPTVALNEPGSHRIGDFRRFVTELGCRSIAAAERANYTAS